MRSPSASPSVKDLPAAPNMRNNFAALPPSTAATRPLSARNTPSAHPRDTTLPDPVPSSSTILPPVQSCPCRPAAALACTPPANRDGTAEPSPPSLPPLGPAQHFPQSDKHTESPMQPTPIPHPDEQNPWPDPSVPTPRTPRHTTGS